MKGSRLWLGLNALMLLVFGLSALVQYNDPDPVPWMLIYGAAAAACASGLAGRGGRVFPALVALVAAVWAISIVPTALGHEFALADLVADMQMKGGGVEEAREAIGLFIVAGWTAVLAWRAHVRGAAGAATAEAAAAGTAASDRETTTR